MVTSRFFIENSEVIGLWAIYAIVMLLAYCIIETVINSIVSKIKRRKMQRQNEFYRLANKARVSSQIRAVMSAEL